MNRENLPQIPDESVEFGKKKKKNRLKFKTLEQLLIILEESTKTYLKSNERKPKKYITNM